jgi:glycosyltransferase involved in cell wall biosynthesis
MTLEMPGGGRSYQMARRLVAAGHEVQMVTSWRKPTKKRGWFTTVEEGIQVHWLPVPYSNNMSFRERIFSFIRFAFSSARKAASLDGDVIFATSTPLTIALPGIYASWRKKIPMVFEVRDLWPEIPIAVGAISSPVSIKVARLLELAAYRFSASIVALSPGMKDGIVRTGYSPDSVTVIPNSCDLDLFDVPKKYGDEFRSRYEWLGNRPLVIYTGALGFINGVGYLVKIAKRVMELDPDIRFLVVGKGKEKQKIIEAADLLGVLNKNFFMIPEIPKREMPYVLSAADVTTSLVINMKELWANSANKFFDSLAAGKPIAINHEGWQADLLRKTGAGLVLDPVNIDQSAKILLQVIKDRAWIEKAGLAAKKLAHDEFSRELLAKRLEAVLRSAVDEKNNK